MPDRPEHEVAELVTSIEALDPVEDQWRELAVARGNPFITPEWYRSWHGHYGVGQEVVVALLRRADGSLRGVVPLAGDLTGAPRRIRFAGANFADHLHPAAAPGDEIEVAAAAGRAIAAAGRWSMVVLDNVDVGAAWARALVSAAGHGARSYRQTALPRVDLSSVADWDEYLATRSRNFRSQIGRFERRLERDHRLEYRRSTDPDRLSADLACFFRLHDARWEARGGSSSAGARARGFHADFAAAALARGWLRLWFLELDSEPVAAWYGWSLGGRYAYYLAGFNPGWSDRRVGLVLLARTLRGAIEEGAVEYDMLLGEETYKDRFATSRVEVETVMAGRARHPAGLLVAAEVGGWRLLSRLPEERRRRLRGALDGIARRLPGERSR